MQIVIAKRLKKLGKTRMWLAEQIDVRPATIYDFMGGKGARVGTLERILAVLGLEIREKTR